MLKVILSIIIVIVMNLGGFVEAMMPDDHKSSKLGGATAEVDANNFIVLNNGIKMPKIGYGVYQIPSYKTESCVADAIKCGYRSIDTAQCYGNERAVGNAVRKSGIARNEFFITTKLWGCRGYEDTLRSIESSLKELNLDYIDLLLIHEPTGNFLEIYRAMEKFYNEGKLKAIGVANFLEENYLKLVKNVKVIPAVNQVETHVFRQQHELRRLMSKYGTQLESWSPLACGQHNFFGNKVLNKIAVAHGRTIAQIGLRYLYQQGIIIIPKSTHIERMTENMNILDFSLTRDEMETIKSLDEGKSLFSWW